MCERARRVLVGELTWRVCSDVKEHAGMFALCAWRECGVEVMKGHGVGGQSSEFAAVGVWALLAKIFGSYRNEMFLPPCSVPLRCAQSSVVVDAVRRTRKQIGPRNITLCSRTAT